MAKLYTRKSDGTYVPYNPQSVTNIDVVQTTGDSVTAAMSQDAVTKKLATKQDTLTPSNGISIEGNMIGVTTITESESQPHTSLWVNPSEDEETDVTYNRSQINAMLGEKQDALTLTVKDNGNIVLSNIQGQSKEFMPATPSGDPMHYAYEAAGALWNGTGKDIARRPPWADLADDDADKTVMHKAGYWYLNGLGDIDNAEMSYIYRYGIIRDSALLGRFVSFPRRLVYIRLNSAFFLVDINSLAYFSQKLVALEINGGINIKNSSYAFYNCTNLIYIGKMRVDNAIPNVNTFFQCNSLKFIKFNSIASSWNFQYSPNLTCKSILHMIQNEAATSAITITLHADAYARAMANADIVAALEAHPNVSLASA